MVWYKVNNSPSIKKEETLNDCNHDFVNLPNTTEDDDDDFNYCNEDGNMEDVCYGESIENCIDKYDHRQTDVDTLV